MMTRIRNKSNQKRDRAVAGRRWFFNVTPDSQAEMLRRICFLLELIQHADASKRIDDVLGSWNFRALVFGLHEIEYECHLNHWHELAWEKFRNKMERQFGRFVNDSTSTLATIDDSPGTGRCIDNYVYQPIGRSIERLLLAMELRYFRPPERSARQIIEFLEASAFSGRHIPDDEICDHSFLYEYFFADEAEKNVLDRMSLFLEISRAEEIVKAFQRLLIQASSKQRSMRVEAQKLIWSLFRYNNTVVLLSAMIDLWDLVWDGYSTFQHCSPLDLDLQTHFSFRWDLEIYSADALVVMFDAKAVHELLHLSIRNILETCARENRGFSSLPISLVFDKLKQLVHYTYNNMCTEETAEELYLTLIAIQGYFTKYPYASSILKRFDVYELGDPKIPSRIGGRSESEVKTIELLCHFFISLLSSGSDKQRCEERIVEKCCLYLNDVDDESNPMTELEARAFEDYLHKINEALVRRGPVTFEIFKDMVSKPLTWERYCQPVRRRIAGNQARGSSTWNYTLDFSINIFPNSSLLFWYFTPFSRESGSFALGDYGFILNPYLYREHKWTELWFKIRDWLAALNRNSMTLPGDRPGTPLYTILERWRNFVPNPLPNPPPVHDLLRCVTSPFRLHCEIKSSRLSSIIEELVTPATDDMPQEGLAREPAPTPPSPPSPCEYSICKPPLRENGMDGTLRPWIEDTSFECRNVVDHVHLKESTESPVSAAPAGQLLSVASTEVGPAAKDCAFEEGDDTIETCSDRRSGRMVVAAETRVSRSFSSSDSDEDQSLEDAESLQPPRKKQKMTYEFEYSASDTDSMMTEVVNGPPDSAYEDDMSTDEDFWSAKSTAELSLASLD